MRPSDGARLVRSLSTLSGTMLVLALLALPSAAYFYDSDGDGLPDFREIKHGLHGDLADEGHDWDGDGLGDAEEDANGNGVVDVGETDPYNWDSDGDGLSDGIETLDDDADDADDLINALDLDSDGDWIPDSVEEQIQIGDTYRDGVYEGPGSNETDWLDADTDDDGIVDGLEVMWGTDPQVANTDNPSDSPNGDRWSDGEEVMHGTDPLDPDTDGDGRVDGLGNEDEGDADGDGMCNAVDFDSDNDGLIDGDEDSNENGEVGAWETDPELYDTDGDGFSDGYEVHHAHTDPLDGGVDSDGDGWMDGEETVLFKTDPYNDDTDGDGIEDGVENPVLSPGLDSDGDGLIDDVTDPTRVDTDGDDLPDGAETQIFGSDPTNADDPWDGDDVSAGDEIYVFETRFDTNDTDADGVPEGLSGGTDRVDMNSDHSRPRPFGDSALNAIDRDADGDGLTDGEDFWMGRRCTSGRPIPLSTIPMTMALRTERRLKDTARIRPTTIPTATPSAMGSRSTSGAPTRSIPTRTATGSSTGRR